MTERSAPLKSVYVTTATCGAIAAAYGLAGVRPSAIPTLFISVAPLISVALWLETDARLRHFSGVHDWGLFVLLLWPVLVPWYVVTTRGPKAWRMAAGFLGAAVAAPVFMFAATVWHALFVTKLVPDARTQAGRPHSTTLVTPSLPGKIPAAGSAEASPRI